MRMRKCSAKGQSYSGLIIISLEFAWAFLLYVLSAMIVQRKVFRFSDLQFIIQGTATFYFCFIILGFVVVIYRFLSIIRHFLFGDGRINTIYAFISNISDI